MNELWKENVRIFTVIIVPADVLAPFRIRVVIWWTVGQDTHAGYILTHLSLDKMAADLADDIFRCSFVNEKFCIWIKISVKFVPKSPIDNNPALV